MPRRGQRLGAGLGFADKRREKGMSAKGILILLIIAAAVSVALIVGFSTRTGDDAGTDRDLKDRLAKLRSVPYTTVTKEEVTDEASGVTLLEEDRVFPGYNLYCSGVYPAAYLMDMGGNIIHTWTYYTGRTRRWTWVHAVLTDNGDLIVIDRYKYLLRLDWESNLLWLSDRPVHHDIALLPDSTILTIEREFRNHRGLVVRFPAIVHLGSDGEEIERWSTFEHLSEIKQAFDQRSFLDTILDSMLAAGGLPQGRTQIPGRLTVTELKGEIVYESFHMNTISLLPENPLYREDARFQPGNLLICFRNVNQIAILDKDTKEILWVWGEGELQWPHHPTMVDNGNILVFDNGVLRGYSRVLELNPITGEIEWQYTADPPRNFYTYEKGSAQRFPNGNTLICEGDRGRVFEVTKDGEIVWEWLNPATKKFRRVQVYRMLRLTPEAVEPLLTEG